MFDILLVEDNDAELMMEVIKEAFVGIPHQLHLVVNGEQALQRLRTRDTHPDLVLLDLNLPIVSGIEVLITMKKDPKLRGIPVIIMSNSQSQDDVSRCYNAYANAYVRKQIGFEQMTAQLQVTGTFWFQTATLPAPFHLGPVSTSTPPKGMPAIKTRKKKTR